MSKRSVTFPRREEGLPPQEQHPPAAPPVPPDPAAVSPSTATARNPNFNSPSVSPSHLEQLRKENRSLFSPLFPAQARRNVVTGHEVNEGQELQASGSSCSSSKPVNRPLFDNSGENDDDDNTREKKKKLKEDVLGSGEDDEPIFEKYITLEAEIELFNHILWFNLINKKYPFSDSAAFNDFYKNWLDEGKGTTASLLLQAIQSLKMKYQRVAVKIRVNMGHFRPSNREIVAFELAKAIWKDIDNTGIEGSVNDDDDNTQEKKKLKEDVLGSGEDDENAEEGQEKPIFEKHVTLEAEIAFFNHILGFNLLNKKYPFSDFTALDDFYKNWLDEGKGTPAILILEAIQSLKRKYQRMAVKIRENLGHLEPSNRESVALELAKAIWKDIDNTGIEESVNDDDDNAQEKKKKLEDVLGSGEDDENAEEGQDKPFLEKLSSDKETEISFFNHILGFNSLNKKYPFSDSAAFDDFYKNWFDEGEGTPASLLLEAFQSLKRKYQRMAVKVRENFGHFQPSHRESIAFELAKAIWKDIDNTGIEESVNEEKFIGEGHWQTYPYLSQSLKLHRSISNVTILKGLGLIANSKIKELDDEWENFWEQQMQVTLKQNELMLKEKELILKQERLFIDAIESSSCPQNPN